MNTIMKSTLAAMIALGLSACGPQSQQEAAEDVAEARQESAENLAEVRQDTQEDLRDAQRDLARADDVEEMADQREDLTRQGAEAEYELAVTEAEGRLEVAQQQCDTLGGDAHDRCDDQAQMQFENEKELAEQRLDAAQRAQASRNYD